MRGVAFYLTEPKYAHFPVFRRRAKNAIDKSVVASIYKRPLRIVSGGQTGVDRAALDFAIEHRIPHGGWCPLGRVAEDGPLDGRYCLKETETSSYRQRTHRNIQDSDGTLIIAQSQPLRGGTRLTERLASLDYKPVLVVLQTEPLDGAQERLLEFVENEFVRVLNVAGPRGSGAPGIEAFVRQVLEVLRPPLVNGRQTR